MLALPFYSAASLYLCRRFGLLHGLRHTLPLRCRDVAGEYFSCVRVISSRLSSAGGDNAKGWFARSRLMVLLSLFSLRCGWFLRSLA